ncbi:MAG: hypothetical protein ACOC9P_00655 [bacterium]
MHTAPPPFETRSAGIDDTITRHPPFFALLSRSLVDAGHRVIIITFRDDAEVTADDLRDWGVVYHDLICWSMQAGDLADVDAWKATVCREHGVEVFFEDDPDVLAHVDAATVCFMPFDPAARIPR